jgi:hypothetical protein
MPINRITPSLQGAEAHERHARARPRAVHPKTVSRNRQTMTIKAHTPINRKLPRSQGAEAHDRHASTKPRAEEA